MNAFLLSFDSDQVDREHFLEAIDAIPEIANWYAFFPGSVAIVSHHDATAVTKQLRRKLPEARFFVTRIEKGGRGGYIPRSVWAFIKDPRSVDAIAS